jgi:acetate kinase
VIVLVFNAGSSSLKAGLYDVGRAGIAHCLVDADIQGIGKPDAKFSVRDGDGDELLSEPCTLDNERAAAERFCDFLADSHWPDVEAVGHRIVHGGPDIIRHTVIDQAVAASLARARSLAPLHVPPALDVLTLAKDRFPSIPQIACLDTAFHAALPPVARTLAVDPEALGVGIHRYGFHGLSCESIVRQLGHRVPARLVVAHLGGGASVTAIAKGQSVDTSMGLTPMGGILMGSRPGDLDPGLLMYLMREKRMGPDELENLLDRRSGLTGVSGIGGDMRKLREAAGTDPRARLAVALFCYTARKQIAAMAAALGGLDCLVFTGGIGEHDAATRSEICRGLLWIGVGDAIPAKVMPADENRQIALQVGALVLATP